MEDRLQDATRKQRLAVESSELREDPQQPAEVLQTSKTRETKRKVGNDKAKDKKNTLEKASIDGIDAELAMGDLVDAKPENDGVERGSRRTPPFNSDQMPLPWTGRLGYVSRPSD